MTTEMQMFQDTVNQIKAHIRGFEIRFKDESWSSRVIGVLCWLFNRKYMTEFTTTRYPRVYFPSRKYVEDKPLRATKILYHEFVHLWDRKQKGFWFTVGYAFPQWIGLLLLVTFIVQGFFLSTKVWWMALVIGIPMLVCLTPLPAYWRMKTEMRGYAMNLAFNQWRYGSVRQWTKDWVTDIFTGPSYCFMWPFEKSVRKFLDEVIGMLDGSKTLVGWMASYQMNELPYSKAYEMLDKHGMLGG